MANTLPLITPHSTAAQFTGQVSLVTGATSGIGRAIALELSRRGAIVCAVGRTPSALRTLEREAPSLRGLAIDLNEDEAAQAISNEIGTECNRLDILVHCAGVISLGKLESASVQEFDRQYRINVRAPFLLTQALLPFLREAHGQIAFVNSTAGVTAPANAGQYAATKHALKAIADSLREEVNPDGIRVISVFPGRTATPMQAGIHQAEGKPWHPEALMQPEDVAEALLSTLSLPRTAEATNLFLRPMRKG